MKKPIDDLVPTKIKDLYPQLFCIGKVLGMNLYIDMRVQRPEKYDLAQKVLKNAFYPPEGEE